MSTVVAAVPLIAPSPLLALLFFSFLISLFIHWEMFTCWGCSKVESYAVSARFIAVEVLVEVPIQHLASARDQVHLAVPTNIGSRQKAFARLVAICVEFSRFVSLE